MSSRIRAGRSVRFQNACRRPRGFTTISPTSAVNDWLSISMPILPSRTTLVLAGMRVHRRAKRARCERVLEEREASAARFGLEKEDRAERSFHQGPPVVEAALERGAGRHLIPSFSSERYVI